MAISQFKKMGFIMDINPELNEAQVNPGIWSTSTYKEKQKIAVILAKYCQVHGDGHIMLIYILDGYSGKTLADFDGMWGYSTKQ